MKVRSFGKSGLAVNAIGLGTGFEFKQKSDFKKNCEIIRAAINLGLNLIDTAENYANGLSEKTTGEALKGLRAKAVVSSKFSAENSRFKEVIKSCDNSLRRLKTDYIDLYQIHWPNPTVPLEETLSALVKLKKLGKIREIGISNFSPKELELNRNLLLESKVVSLQAEYNLFERTAEFDNTFYFCSKNKFSFIAYSPLDQGRLKQTNTKQSNLLFKLSEKYGKTNAQIILRWVVNRDNIIAIPRTSNILHLREISQVLDFDIEDRDLNEISKTFTNPVKYIAINKIIVSRKGERNRAVYQTLKEATENKFGFVPSPNDLAQSLKMGNFLRPIRLVPVNRGSKNYHLVNGRIRFWAWVIAYGDSKPIPAYVRDYV